MKLLRYFILISLLAKFTSWSQKLYHICLKLLWFHLFLTSKISNYVSWKFTHRIFFRIFAKWKVVPYCSNFWQLFDKLDNYATVSSQIIKIIIFIKAARVDGKTKGRLYFMALHLWSKLCQSFSPDWVGILRNITKYGNAVDFWFKNVIAAYPEFKINVPPRKMT